MKNQTCNSYRLSGLLLLLPLLATPARAQAKFGAIQTYVKQHTQPIATIDPAAPDNADLAAIGRAIGAARVVMLGQAGPRRRGHDAGQNPLGGVSQLGRLDDNFRRDFLYSGDAAL